MEFAVDLIARSIASESLKNIELIKKEIENISEGGIKMYNNVIATSTNFVNNLNLQRGNFEVVEENIT